MRRRYDALNTSFICLLEQILQRCNEARVPVSFCGEDAGRPIEAVTFAALGFRRLSMRPASIGPVKHLIRRTDLSELKAAIDAARAAGETNLRRTVTDWLARN